MYKFGIIISLIFLLSCSEDKKCYIVVENYSRGEYGSLITRLAYPAYSYREAKSIAHKLYRDNEMLDSLVQDWHEVEKFIYIKDCQDGNIELHGKKILKNVSYD